MSLVINCNFKLFVPHPSVFRLRFESCYGGFPKICAIQVLKNVNIANYVSVLNEQDQLTFSLQL